MKPLRITVLCLLCAFGLVLRPVVAPTHAQSAPTVVTIQDYAFSPATVTINAGSTVVWSNHESSVDHTSTSDTGVWDVPDIPHGTSSRGIVFNTPGTYPYHCSFHPDMHGTVIVLAGGSGPTPTPPATATVGANPAPTSTPVPTVGAPPAPTATSTPLPLFVKLAIGHKTVKAGAKQSIKVTTLAGAAITIVVTFPDGAKKRHTATAAANGTLAWTFKQPGGHTTRAKHAAKVSVTVSKGAGSAVKSAKSYTIR